MRSNAHAVAASALMCALLLVVQFVLSFLQGVELVTALLLAFSYFFGKKCGVMTATAFSLLRCLLFGFFLNVVVLYLVYFNAFALFFGWLGERERRTPAWVCPALFLLLAGGALSAALLPVPVSALYLPRLRGAAWTLFAVMLWLLILYTVLYFLIPNGRKTGSETALLAGTASLFTVLFTLLDDCLTPLICGYSSRAALAYFYAGFLAMLPQTVCAAVSVAVLFPVLKRIFGGVRKNAPSNVGRIGRDMV